VNDDALDAETRALQVRPMTRALLLASIAALGLACGGPAAPAATVHATADAPATPGAKCLATANAQREKKPGEPIKVGAKQVLVKSKDSKRAPDTVTRTREEACLRAIEARDKLRGGADFADVVKDYSDEPGASTRGGSIGTFERSELAPPVADAVFELQIGELSDVVESEYGFHVLQRTD
jgi:hypothetical protein